jgi:hypothetical protein
MNGGKRKTKGKVMALRLRFFKVMALSLRTLLTGFTAKSILSIKDK